jgi:hypothetical protein
MKIPCLAGAFGSLLLSFSTTALAVQPASVKENDRGPWSQIINDPFDGAIVFDKDFNDVSTFVTTWSPKEIRATLVEHRAITVGYRQVRKYGPWHNGRRRSYYETERITADRVTSPTELKFAIYGKVYTYTDGVVPADLAEALSNAPAGDMFIRAVWPDTTNSTMRIGPQTVLSWRTIFKAKAAAFGL